MVVIAKYKLHGLTATRLREVCGKTGKGFPTQPKAKVVDAAYKYLKNNGIGVSSSLFTKADRKSMRVAKENYEDRGKKSGSKRKKHPVADADEDEDEEDDEDDDDEDDEDEDDDDEDDEDDDDDDEDDEDDDDNEDDDEDDDNKDYAEEPKRKKPKVAPKSKSPVKQPTCKTPEAKKTSYLTTTEKNTVRDAVWSRFFDTQHEGRCCVCKTPVAKTIAEGGHIVSASAGGGYHSFNIVPICGRCNKKQGGKNLLDFMVKGGSPDSILDLVQIQFDTTVGRAERARLSKAHGPNVLQWWATQMYGTLSSAVWKALELEEE